MCHTVHGSEQWLGRHFMCHIQWHIHCPACSGRCTASSALWALTNTVSSQSSSLSPHRMTVNAFECNTGWARDQSWRVCDDRNLQCFRLKLQCKKDCAPSLARIAGLCCQSPLMQYQVWTIHGTLVNVNKFRNSYSSSFVAHQPAVLTVCDARVSMLC